MKHYLLLILLTACEGTDTETTTETVVVAESVEHHEIVISSSAPGELCPGASPYQLHACALNSDGLGTETCWDVTDGITWSCTHTIDPGYEYRLSWWQASEPAPE